MSPDDRDWPPEVLERVDRCPVCGSTERALLYEGLRDRIFFCAPGSWSLHECRNCGSAYLDPRPTPATIGLAYETYFTHQESSSERFERLKWLRRIRRVLANGYRNRLLGTNLQPASRLGVLAAALMPYQRAVIEAELRQIPRATPGMRLLDIGCGNGEFLVRARFSGWDVVGVDPDPKAVEVARSRGLDVRVGGVEVLDPARERFDGITLSHVVEHVHEPLIVLRKCHALLKPRGWIWIETPNLNALGHQRYRAYWRGLEPPRHLVLFTRTSLIRILKRTGFQVIEDQPCRPLCAGMFAASEAMARGDDPRRAVELSKEGRRAVKAAERKARKDPEIREFITVKAWKQG